MIKIIIITIVLLLFIQFVLYYCNVDLFKFYINKQVSKDTNDTNDTSYTNDLEETKEILKGFVNELKQYDNII
jgi:hypothetical protein